MTNCLHDKVHREYDKGGQGDFVCEDCGDTFGSRDQLEQARQQAKEQQQK